MISKTYKYISLFFVDYNVYMKKFLYKISGFEKFKNLSTHSQTSYLYFELFALEVCFLVFLLFSIFNPVHAQEIQNPTYTDINANICYKLQRVGNQSKMDYDFISSVGGRAVYLNWIGDDVYYIIFTDPSGLYNISTHSDSDSCSAGVPSTSFSVDYGQYDVAVRTSSYNGITFYYVFWDTVGYRYNLLTPIASVNLGSESPTPSLAYRYTYGDLAVGPQIDYSKVELIYPPGNTSVLRDYSFWFNKNNKTDSRSFGLYLTRYVKNLDLIASYYLVFNADNSPGLDYSVGWNSFDYSYSNNQLTVEFNDLMPTQWGCTSVYDYDLFQFYTITNDLTNDLSHLDDWNTYGIIYPNLKDPGVIDLYLTIWFDKTQQFLYSDLDIPSTLVFDEITTDYTVNRISTENDIHKLKVYSTVVDSADYYDYYLVLSLADGPDSSVSNIYNAGIYTDDSTGLVTDLYYYEIMTFLGLNPHPTFSIAGSSPTNTIEDLINGTQDDDLIENDNNNGLPSESEYYSFTYSVLYSQAFSDLGSIYDEEGNNISQLLYTLKDNWKYFEIAQNDLVNTNFLNNFQFISDNLTWFYNNTFLKIPIDISLIFGVILAILF